MGTPIPTVAAITCARELTCLLQQTPSQSVHRNSLCLMRLIRVLTSQQLFDKTVFIHELALKVNVLPLDLLWQLHSCSAISLDQYIQHNMGSVSVLHRLTQDITNLCIQLDDLDQDTHALKKGVLAVLVRCGYSKSEEQFDQRLANVSREILDGIVAELLTLQNQSKATIKDYYVARMFEMIRCNLELDKDVISRFSAKQLMFLLQCNPDCDVSTAVSRQHDKWTYIKAPESITKMFTQLLLTINEKQVCTVIQHALHEEKINWPHILVLVSVFCVCFRRGASLIKDLVTELLKESLCECISILLYAAFLLARQAAAEETCDFPSYPRWFQDQFSTSGSLHVSSSKTFSFFMEFLNSLVPHEPVHCLKAHIQYQPYMPYKCRDVLMDYIALAKTRLADFKEGWQINGSTRTCDGQKNQAANQQAVEDVELAVSTFEKTGRIHEKILQSSIFRRPYYMGQFLPALLVPRMLPEIPDCKMQFIEALKRSEKIPRHMYDKYTAECALELRTLLEGVSSQDMDDLSLEPVQILQDTLDSLTDVLMKDPVNAAYGADIAGHMSIIAGRVPAVLEDLGVTSGSVSNKEHGITLDICENAIIEPAIMKVTDMLLSCFCKAHLLLMNAKLSCSALVNENFSLTLTNQGPLSYVTYYRLFTLLCHQGDTLSDEHIAGLASLLVHMSTLGERLPHVKLRTPAKHLKEDEEPDYMCLLHLICANLPHCTGNEMRFTHKFCRAVLTNIATFTESIQNEIISKQLIQKFCYLHPRQDPASRLKCISVPGQPSSDQSEASSINKQGEFEQELLRDLGIKIQLSHQYQLSLEDWIHQELRIHRCQDFLTPTQRKQYHHWILYSHFLPQLIQTTYRDNPTLAYMRASTIILHGLLDRYAEPSIIHHEHCPHRHSTDQAWKRDSQCIQSMSLCQEVIQLLQELLRLWSTVPSAVHEPVTGHDTASIETDCSWLLAQFESRLQRISTQRSADDNLNLPLKLSLELSNQMLLCQSLPPYLLLTDSLGHHPYTMGWSHLICYINVYLREHLQDNFCGFGYSTVAIIMQGILQMYTCAVESNSGEVKDIVARTEQLLQECPLFTLSVLRHWDMLAPLISHRNTRCQDVDLFTLLHQVHGLIHGMYNEQPSIGLPLADVIGNIGCKEWLLVIVVVGAFILYTNNSSSVDELVDLNRILFNHLEQYFSEEKISVCLFDYYIAQGAWSILTQSSDHATLDVHCQAAGNLLNKHPKSIKTCTGSSILQQDIIQKSLTSLYPVICFRILQGSSCQRVLWYASRDGDILTCILLLYSSLIDLHCHIDTHSTAIQQQQIINLEFLDLCRTLLSGVIRDCSSHILAAVDETLLADIDPELRSLIAQRLL